jgi:hypothetical protein
MTTATLRPVPILPITGYSRTHHTKLGVVWHMPVPSIRALVRNLRGEWQTVRGRLPWWRCSLTPQPRRLLQP